MKKQFLTLRLLALAFVAIIMVGLMFAAQSTVDTTTGPYRQSGIQMVTVTFDNDWPHINLNNHTHTLSHIQGKIVRIAYDSTGTDTDWDLELLDAVGIAIFSKEELTSASEPGSYAVCEASTDGNYYSPGVVVSGGLSVDIDGVAQAAEVQTCAAANDADAGTYTITIDGQTTSAMAFDAATAAIDANLEALSNIGSGKITSVVSTLDAANSVPIVITFDASIGNVPSAVFADVTDTNSGTVAVAETTEGGNAFSSLIIYIWYEQ